MHLLGVCHHVVAAREHLEADGTGDLLLVAVVVRRQKVAAEVADVRVGLEADVAAEDMLAFLRAELPHGGFVYEGAVPGTAGGRGLAAGGAVLATSAARRHARGLAGAG